MKRLAQRAPIDSTPDRFLDHIDSEMAKIWKHNVSKSVKAVFIFLG